MPRGMGAAPMKMVLPAWLGAMLLAAAVSEGAIAPVEDPDACLSAEQRAELAHRGKELFFRGGGNTQLALSLASYREAGDALERAQAELRRCESAAGAPDPGTRRCSAQREAAAGLERRAAAARAEYAKRSDELADELTARARKMREEFPACAAVR